MKTKIKYPNIAAEMGRCRYTQKELATRLGISNTCLHYRLYGIVEWKLDEMIKLSNIFGKDINYLISKI